MRCSSLLPFALFASATASQLLPLAALATSQFTRRQNQCDSLCKPVESKVNACGMDLTCLCTTDIAQGLQRCAVCEYEADPASSQTLQSALDQYASGCQSMGSSVGSLTLPITATTTSTSAGSSRPSSTITSARTIPSLGTSTASVAASVSSANQSAISGFASSSSAILTSAPSATPTNTGSGNGASVPSIQMTGTVLAAIVVSAFAVF